MPESVTRFDEMPLYDIPAGPASIRQAAGRRRLRSRFLRAGREAVDDRDLLDLLLSGRRSVDDARALSGSLLATFGTAPRALAARPNRLRTVPGLSEEAIAALKAAEALGIRMARADVPETVRPSLGSYDKVIEYCRTLAGHREVEEFRILYLNRKNALLTDECHQRGTVCHTPRLSAGDLRPGAGASGQRGHCGSQPSQQFARSVPRRHRHDEPHQGCAEDHRGHAARPSDYHPDRGVQLPGPRSALTGRGRPPPSLFRKEPGHARTRQRCRIRSRHPPSTPAPRRSRTASSSTSPKPRERRASTSPSR